METQKETQKETKMIDKSEIKQYLFAGWSVAGFENEDGKYLAIKYK